MAGNKKTPLIDKAKTELKHVENQFEQLSTAVVETARAVVSNISSEGSPSMSYQQWLILCQQLRGVLQDLNQPNEVKEVKSIHDFIFWIHKSFVKNLAAVAESSGQGEVVEFRHVYTDHLKKGARVDFLKPGEKGLVNELCLQALSKFDADDLKVLNLPTACRVNAALGMHVCELDMYEQAEGGKGRKIRFSLSDDFSTGHHKSGKIKRFFYLIGALQAVGMDRERTHIRVNPASGKLTVEYYPIESTAQMQKHFAHCLTLLGSIRNFDLTLEEKDIHITEHKDCEF